MHGILVINIELKNMHGSASLRSLPPCVLLDTELPWSQVPLSIFNLGRNIQVLACDISLHDSSQFCRMGMNG